MNKRIGVIEHDGMVCIRTGKIGLVLSTEDALELAYQLSVNAYQIIDSRL